MNSNKIIVFLIIIPSLLLIILSCSNGEDNHNLTEEQNKTKIEIKQNNKQKRPKQDIITEVSNYNYAKMKAQIQNLDQNYQLLKISSIGKSVQDRELYLIKVGSGKKKVGVVGGVHGREAITSLLILKLAEEYIKEDNSIANYNLKDLLTKVTFYFIPMLNPDGVEIALNNITGLTNKNFYLTANEGSSDFKRWKANARGVDLNKQFRADWQELESTTKPHFSDSKGSAPESEAESKALADLTRREEFDTVVAFHHSGNVIYWYYNQEGEAYQRDYHLAQKISRKNRYKVVTAEDSDSIAAGYKDWFIKEFKRPGFTIEIAKSTNEEPLPSSNLNLYFNENKEVLLELATLISNQ